MSRKAVPYMFLALLLAVLLFILGVRYGQSVEKVNKTISYLVSLPPSPTVAPTLPPLGFSTYTHSDCGVSFLIPNLIEKTKEGSNSALFSTQKKQLALAVSCEKKPFIQEKNELVVTINRTIRAFQVVTADTASFRFYNAKNAKIVTITSSKQYLPLIEKSLELTTK
ncbi:MAG: hypothetical protein NTZ55_02420 [Candidatus Roizmanbacteria bacterium]|nr:hypothetical protein [Candidatus Roizmanbacteria bacterium]